MNPPVPTDQRSLAIALLPLALLCGCGDLDPLQLGAGSFYNLTATRRGNVLIGFVNNTDARAIFTFGGYDPLDEQTTPVFGQLRLEAGNSSNQITQACRRRFSVGSRDLVRLVQQRGGTGITDSAALIEGQVNFSAAPAAGDLAAAATEGTAAARTVDLGADYLCAGLMLFSFEEDDAAQGGFRIDYTFVPQQ